MFSHDLESPTLCIFISAVDTAFTSSFKIMESYTSSEAAVAEIVRSGPKYGDMETAKMEQHGARFASHHEEVPPDQSPEPSLQAVETITGLRGRKREDLDAEEELELQRLKTTLKNNMQMARMQHYAFEPVSLPGSVPGSPSGSEPASRVSSSIHPPIHRSCRLLIIHV